MSSIITIEHISKKYFLRHNKRPSYTTLRDLIGNGTKDLVGRLLHPKLQALASPKFDEFWALDDVTFDIKQGERLGIIGRNGAGKSTLLKILSRITEPSSGRATIKGRLSSLLEVGTGFHPELTGRENIFLNGAILSMTRSQIRRQFDEIVDFAGIAQFIDTQVKHYSSGMYMRLAFSVAAHLEPDILIIDEVLAVGDIQFQKQCIGKLEQVGNEGRTVIFVSHNMGAIRSLCTRAILLENGKNVSDGSPESIIGSYISGKENKQYVADGIQHSILENETARVSRVELLDENYFPINSITTDMTFSVEITYTNKIAGASIGLNVMLNNSDGTCVFASINNHEEQWYGKPMPAGSFKSRCKIPKHFLNDGVFMIRIATFSKGFSDFVISNEILTFEVLDGIEVRADYFGGYSGCTRPLFNWTTIFS